MADKGEVQNELKTTAEARAAILIASLANSINNGTAFVNESRKSFPAFYDAGNGYHRVLPANALIMAMASDQEGYKTNLFTSYKDAHENSTNVRGHEQGVPYTFLDWKHYEKISDPSEIITQEQRNSLPADQRDKYQVKTLAWSLFNLEQTTMPWSKTPDYNALVAKYGGVSDRAALKTEAGEPTEEDIKKEDNVSKVQAGKYVSGFVQKVNTYLIPVAGTSSSTGRFDKRWDAVRIPPKASYDNIDAYNQDVFRQIALATGGKIRLNRPSGNKADTSRELLVAELVSAYKMLELGRSATLSDKAAALAPAWIEELKQNPQLANEVMRDVEKSVYLMEKAEKGQKVALNVNPVNEAEKALKASTRKAGEHINFEVVSALKHNGDWLIMAKPENGETFAIKPSKAEMSLFFGAIKDQAKSAEEKNTFKQQFANKLYGELSAQPDRAVNIFKSDVPQQGVDLITKVSLFKTKGGATMIQATIGGESQKARIISSDDWAKMRFAPNVKEYKTHLAATTYREVVEQKMKAAAAQTMTKQLPQRQELTNEQVRSRLENFMLEYYYAARKDNNLSMQGYVEYQGKPALVLKSDNPAVKSNFIVTHEQNEKGFNIFTLHLMDGNNEISSSNSMPHDKEAAVVFMSSATKTMEEYETFRSESEAQQESRGRGR